MKTYSVNLFSAALVGLLLVCLSSPQALVAQTANPTYNSYSGQSTLSGTESVRLLPGFHAPSGSNLRVFIAGYSDLGSLSGVNRNYIQKTVYFEPLTAVPVSTTTGQAMRDITYFDGLGRTVQEVGVKASGGNGFKDVVVPVAYDAYGRQDRDYLPYATDNGAGGVFKIGAIAAQGSYYGNPATVPTGQSVNAYPYGLRIYEASPLDRVLEQGFPGAEWQPQSGSIPNSGHTARTTYTTNNATAFGTVATTRKAARYGVSLDATGNPTLIRTGDYAANELHVTVSRDENWQDAVGFTGRLHTSEEYTDKQGRVVLQRTFNTNGSTNEVLSTYYVYNIFGQLSFVLPPGTGPDRDTGVPNANELENFGYWYRYDGKGRMAYKKVPGGGGWQAFVYTKTDWLVYQQDSLQRTTSYAGFTGGPYQTFYKYDASGRLIMKGLEKGLSGTRENRQSAVDSQPNFWEYRVPTALGSGFHGYTNSSLPNTTANLDVHEVNYYHSYDILDLPDNTSASHSKLTLDKLVARKVKVVDSNPAVYLWTVYYYDDHGRVVREYRQHYQGGGTVSVHDYDEITNEYTFAGQVKKSTRKHYTGTGSAVRQVTVVTDYDYDHRQRLTGTWKTVIPAGASTGTKVLLAGNDYNEVGQLRSKTLHQVGTDSPVETIAYSYNARGWMRYINSGRFKQMLRYADGDTVALRQYNGNIGRQTWRHGTGSVQDYVYTYDALGRLLSGIANSGSKSETLSYNRMGNIATLKRDDTGPLWTYDYGTTSSNRLQGITDGITSYLYDANGNMTRDGRSNRAITYNRLNLPATVSTSPSTAYTYDGTGRKLRSAFGTATTDYIDGIEWSGSALSFIQTEEGRIRISGSTVSYDYFVRDHLGNVRVEFTPGGTDTRRTDYYPFGLAYQSGTVLSPQNRYLYNGKELQDGSGYLDYGARLYDPVIGRWGAVDPLAEDFKPFTPYGFTLGNPMAAVDPNGKFTLTGEAAQAFFRQLQMDWKNLKDRDDEYEQNAYRFMFEMNEQLEGDDPALKREKGTGTTNLYLGEIGIGLGLLELGTNSWDKYLSADLYRQGYRKGVSGNYLLTGRNLSLFGNMAASPSTLPITRIGQFGKGFGYGGTTLGVLSAIDDGIGVYKGTLSAGRFGYRITGGSLSLGLGLVKGGGPLGLLVGAQVYGYEKMYDIIAPEVVASYDQFYRTLINSWLNQRSEK